MWYVYVFFKEREAADLLLKERELRDVELKKKRMASQLKVSCWENPKIAQLATFTEWAILSVRYRY